MALPLNSLGSSNSVARSRNVRLLSVDSCPIEPRGGFTELKMEIAAALCQTSSVPPRLASSSLVVLSVSRILLSGLLPGYFDRSREVFCLPGIAIVTPKNEEFVSTGKSYLEDNKLDESGLGN
jgi:hypothetical protein